MEGKKWHAVDRRCAYTAACVLLFLAVKPILSSILLACAHPDRALPLEMIANDFCGFLLHGGVLMLWATLCFGNSGKEAGFDVPVPCSTKRVVVNTWIHNKWKLGLWGQNFMPGGFAPRLFTLSMGLLLFVTGTFCTTLVVPGMKFTKPKGFQFVRWPIGMGCRADMTLPKQPGKSYLIRLWAGSPKGCYNVVGSPHLLDKFLPPAVKDLVHEWWPSYSAQPFWTTPDVKDPSLLHPYLETFAADGTASWHVDTDHICKYQCVKWKPLSVVPLMKNMGSIFTGAAFIDKFINMVSARYGSAFITVDSSAKEVMEAIDRTLKVGPWYFRSFMRCRCLLSFLLVEGFLQALTPHIAKDGFFTVDYYVTLVFLFAFACSVILRSYNPYTLNSIVYTRLLWEKGQDVFVDQKGSKKVDLFEWLHTPPVKRCKLLLAHARRVSAKGMKTFFCQDEEDVPDDDEVDMDVDGEIGVLDGTEASFTSKRMLQHTEALLSIDSRVKALECDNNDVEAVKEVRGYAHTWIPGSEGRPSGWKTVRVSISRHARGIVQGLMDNGTVMVKWLHRRTDGEFVAGVRLMNEEFEQAIVDSHETWIWCDIDIDMLVQVGAEWEIAEGHLKQKKAEFLGRAQVAVV